MPFWSVTRPLPKSPRKTATQLFSKTSAKRNLLKEVKVSFFFLGTSQRKHKPCFPPCRGLLGSSLSCAQRLTSSPSGSSALPEAKLVRLALAQALRILHLSLAAFSCFLDPGDVAVADLTVTAQAAAEALGSPASSRCLSNLGSPITNSKYLWYL